MAQALQLISISINNVLAFIKVSANLAQKAEIKVPSDFELFKITWQDSIGVINFSTSNNIQEKHIKRYRQDQIYKYLHEFKKKQYFGQNYKEIICNK